MTLDDEQIEAIVEGLNDVTVSIQVLASRLEYQAGAAATEARNRCAEANRRLFAAFPEFKEETT